MVGRKSTMRHSPGDAVNSLHLVSTDDLRDFLTVLRLMESDRECVRRGRQGLELMGAGDRRGPDLVSHAFATWLSESRTSFIVPEMSFTKWEAAIERGVGMMLRPPSRLFVDAGMERSLAQHFPIRLVAERSMMAGAFVPTHLVPQMEQLLEQRLVTQLTRLADAEMDSITILGSMLVALQTAREAGLGLIEAVDVIHLDARTGPLLVAPTLKTLPTELRERLELAAKPTKKQSVISRLFRGRVLADPNGVRRPE